MRINGGEMTEEKIEAIIESILFTMGKAVPVSDIAQAMELPEAAVWKTLRKMEREYHDGGRGIMLIELEDSVQMCTPAEYYPWLIRLVSQPKKPILTEAVLETLSIIAYKQPVTRTEIEKIRGVGSDHAVSRLLEYGLIEEKGRLDAPGRPILFGTTEEFLRTFGVASIQDLPVADDTLVEEIKEAAEREIGGSPQTEEAESNPAAEDSEDKEPIQVEI